MVRNERFAYWLDVASDLLQHPLTEFPYTEIAGHLIQTFEVTTLSWEWRESTQEYGFAHFGGDGTRFTPSTLAAFHAREVLARHPLLRWFAASGDPTPQSVGRIPTSVVGQRDRDWFDEHLVPFGVEQQLSIPYWLQGNQYGAFLLNRSQDDFSPEDLDLANRLQQLFIGIHVQVHAQRTCSVRPRTGTESPALTGTETGVLSLLAQGCTAAQIAARLDKSPRTVQKHLEHIYRKLGVTDRLRAVQLATDLGLTHSPGATR
jgi:DNA-binding CsgD family transcriptional regulator